MRINQPALGKFLLRIRKSKQLPIQKAAARAGIGKGLLSRIERGNDTGVNTLQKLLRAYGLRVEIHFK